jgi:hypothetical protein
MDVLKGVTSLRIWVVVPQWAVLRNGVDGFLYVVSTSRKFGQVVLFVVSPQGVRPVLKSEYGRAVCGGSMAKLVQPADSPKQGTVFAKLFVASLL